MQKIFLLVFLIAGSYLQSNGQSPAGPDSTRSGSQQEAGKAIPDIKIEPEIDKGTWSEFLKKHINYDIAAFNEAPRGIYNVKVQFTVFADGHVGDVVALTKYGYGMEKEVIKAIKKSPNWKPAFQNGKFVNAVRIQTVKFVVEVL